MEKTYKVSAPVGSIVTPKDVMTEKELREFMPQLVADPEQNETWKEKVAKDPIEELINWLRMSGFKVTEQ